MARVRRELAAHKLRTGRGDDDLVCGRTASLPFVPSTVRRRAREAWGWKEVRNPKPWGAKTVWIEAGEDALDPLTPHEARHCAGSYLIAAGVNPKELSVYIGHSDIRTTYNVYGHLVPGNEQQAAAKLDVLFGDAGEA
jgi:integrase